ncbi:ATP-binding protein [Oceanobacillus chungangensis]|uniref:ATPase n=1 Tax=Oceanobacillus chungangensis TaxID=1229152 RepID=A0A3D8PZ12_9BACI|nr:ATP-binding protein [Oceanobacillus chungangensis]RDW21264.1 ATPase [Oceanobacillus chungangensis]
MNNKPTLIKYSDTDSNTISHYYDYAVAITKIKEILAKKLGHDFNLFALEEGIEEVFNTIGQILAKKELDVEVIASIYDTLGTFNISYNEGERFSVTPSLVNNIFYFPNYEVAIVRIPIYQSHSDYIQEFVFATDHQLLLNFLNYILEKQRNYMLEGINVLTDTEDGLERLKEQITNQIQREDILLEEDVKTDIYRSIDEFFQKSGTFFKKYNIPYRRGILLYGSPGNGKTTLVKSIAGSVSAPVVYWQITEYTTSYSIKEVFSTVTKMAPMILIIEDIDSMPEHARSVFLNTLDGATSKEGIFLIGTTNYPEKIDPALINRAGRFDRAYEIKQPDDTLRSEYLRKKGLTQFLDEVMLEQVTTQTKGLSIAQLNELYMSVALQWHYEQQIDVDKIVKDLLENQRRTMRQDWETEEYAGRMGF